MSDSSGEITTVDSPQQPTRDGSLLEGGSHETRDKNRLRGETTEMCTADLECNEELGTDDYEEVGGDIENPDSEEEVNSPIDDGNPRVFMLSEAASVEIEGEVLVPVPSATDERDIEELAKLSEGLTPEEVV